MRYVFGFATLFCLLLTQAALAFDATQANPFIYGECKTALQSNCQKISPLLRQTLNLCEINAKTHKCDELAKKNPDLKDLILNCNVEEFCQQQTLSMSNEALSCWNGLKGSVVDQVTGLRDLAVNAWEKAKTHKAQSKAFFEACEKSLPCKRELVKDTPYFSKMSDEKLAGFAATRLYRESEVRRPLGQRREFNPITGEKETETKLSDLWTMAGNMAAEKYHEYSCYNPAAKQELKCYIFASVVDPTMVAGGGLKLLRARRALRVSAQEGGIVSFTSHYLRFSPTTEAQNLRWMALAESSTPVKNIKFFDVENAVMKNLNDTYGNKNLVTSLTNYHKDLLHEKTAKLLEDLKSQYPHLEVEVYSDFKSSRFAFKGQGPPDLENRLNQILQETNQEFASYVTKNQIVEAKDLPETWFRAGFGETADQASLASRYSRQLPDNTMQSYASGSLQQIMGKKLSSTESLRSSLQSDLAQSSVMEGGKVKTLSADAIDILRKNGDDLNQARAELKNRFGLNEISPETVQKMKSYVEAVDEFSPGIHTSLRQFSNLNDASFGGLSADMSGMGAKNLNGTAKALAESRDLDTALAKIRLEERGITQKFNRQKEDFQNIVRDVVGPSRIKTVCSGDDCVAIPTYALSDSEKQKILQKISDQGYSSQFRLSFIPEGVKVPVERTQLSTHGEMIEKELRKNLADKMDPNKLKGLLFGVDMRTPTLGTGEVRLLTATHPEVRLTPNEQKLITESFKKALEQTPYHP